MNNDDTDRRRTTDDDAQPAPRWAQVLVLVLLALLVLPMVVSAVLTAWQMS